MEKLIFTWRYSNCPNLESKIGNNILLYLSRYDNNLGVYYINKVLLFNV